MIEDLPTVGLDELVELRPEKVAGGKDANLRYIGLEHIAQGQPCLLGSLPSSASVSINCCFAKDDILFGKLRPNLRKSLKAPFSGYCSTDILVLRAREGVLPSYAAHVFQWDRVFAAASVTAVGTKMPRTSWNELRRCRVFRPASEVEQSRIAAVLDSVDEAIAKTEAVLAKLRQVRAGLLHDLLTRGLDHHGQLRDPIANPEQFQDSPVGRIPKAWDAKMLESCVSSEITYGIVQAGPHVEGGVPYIRTGDMAGDRLNVDQTLRTSPEIAARFRRSRVQAGEIVCAIRATVGKVLPVPPELDGANLTQGTARIAPKCGTDSTYLLWAIRSYQTQRQFAREVKGTTFFEITLAELRKIRVAIPQQPEEQEQIATAIQNLEARLANEIDGLSKLLNLKSGLMTDLLTGRVRVPRNR
jgi:type I restriction enzyme, S subunit